MEQELIIVKDENGNEIEYESLFRFELAESDKQYIVYTDKNSEPGKEKIYAAIYQPNEEVKLKNIETEKELKLVENVFNMVKETIESETEVGE